MQNIEEDFKKQHFDLKFILGKRKSEARRDTSCVSQRTHSLWKYEVFGLKPRHFDYILKNIYTNFHLIIEYTFILKAPVRCIV